MGRLRLGEKLRKPSDYRYDYPENREIGRGLAHGDLSFIARQCGYAQSYVEMVLKRGIRHNEKIVAIARKLVSLREEIINS